jgi:hypothetical protein
MKTQKQHKKKSNPINEDFPGYPLYPASQDIYNKYKEETEIDPENISKKKKPVTNEPQDIFNEKDFEDDQTGSDLDIPGADLDDAQEDIGSEDEENNYYSLGGDDHNDLEENQGE